MLNCEGIPEVYSQLSTRALTPELRHASVIGFLEHHLVYRRGLNLAVARTGHCTPPIIATPLMLSQAQLSLFGPRVRESIRTTSVPPCGDMRPARALAS